MASATSADAQAAEQALAQDPQFMAMIQRIADLNRQFEATPNQGGQRAPLYSAILQAEQEADNYRKSKGLAPHDWSYNFNTNQLQKDSFLKRNPWAAPLLIGGAAVAAPVAFGALGAAAATPAATASYTSPAAAEAGLSGGLVAPATGAGTAAGTAGAAAPVVATAAKGSSLLHDLLPTIISAGTGLGGAAIAAHGNTEAAKIAAAEADKALEIQKEQYALQRQDTAPYRALGQGAVGNLGYLSGIDVDSKVPELSSTVPKQPYGTLAQLGSPTIESGGTNTGIATGQHSVLVPVRNPQTGLVHLIPNNQVSEAVAARGQVTR